MNVTKSIDGHTLTIKHNSSILLTLNLAEALSEIDDADRLQIAEIIGGRAVMSYAIKYLLGEAEWSSYDDEQRAREEILEAVGTASTRRLDALESSRGEAWQAAYDAAANVTSYVNAIRDALYAANGYTWDGMEPNVVAIATTFAPRIHEKMPAELARIKEIIDGFATAGDPAAKETP